MRALPIVGTLILTACAPQAAPSVCLDLCTNLYSTCGYEAYPTLDSCLQGCEYNAEQGADVGGQLLCIESANCDTFAILECEHAYGLD